MLELLRQIGFALGSREARTRRRRVERHLRAESLSTRRRPSPDLYRRTLAALNDTALEAPPAPVRSAGPAYALALLVVLGLGALAIRLGIPGTTDGLRPPEVAPTLTGFDITRFDALLKQRLDELQNTWKAPLRTEAMHGAGSPQAQRVRIQAQAGFEEKIKHAKRIAGLQDQPVAKGE